MLARRLYQCTGRLTWLLAAAVSCGKPTAKTEDAASASDAATIAAAATATPTDAGSPTDAGLDESDMRAKAEYAAVSDAGSFQEALSAVMPGLTANADGHALSLDSTVLKTRWAASKLRWSDVFVEKSETSRGEMLKDPASTVGKKLCLKVRVDRVRADPGPPPKTFTTELRSNDGYWGAITVRGTGAIVDGSAATFCGVSLGVWFEPDGGKAWPYLLGMFDLPENRKL